MKEKRQAEILHIIAEKDVENQEGLLLELKKRGITATQATVSRDLRDLHLSKEPTGRGGYRYVVTERESGPDFSLRLRTIFREGVLTIDMAQNIVVIKTMPGLAAAAGAAMDGMDLPGLVGSLAGDDTALLIMRTAEQASELCRELRGVLSGM